jgi:hypothetical protein
METNRELQGLVPSNKNQTSAHVLFYAGANAKLALGVLNRPL